MGVFGKKKDTTPRPAAAANVPTPEKQSADKRARFQSQSELDAATKIQSIKRGQDLRRNQTAAMPKAPMNRQLSRRVSFSGRGWGIAGSANAEDGFVGKLLASLNTCLAAAPCLPQEGERRLSLPKDATNSPLRTSEVDKPAVLSAAVTAKVTTLFKKLDENGDGTITKSEAQVYWKSNWAKVNAQAMFNEVDDDGNGEVTYEEWLEFWRNVLAQPDYTEEEVEEELDNMLDGGSWVDWNDGRTT